MWPELPYSEWKDTLDTLHMWMQIIGKIKLAQAPFLNQWWEVAFFVTAYGMSTGLIPYQTDAFQMDFNFLEHTLTIYTSWNKTKVIPLHPQSVAVFYQSLLKELKALGIKVAIWPVPVEVQNPIPFEKDTIHASYDKKYVTRWWRILLNSYLVFDAFRTSFSGKSSPIHFFWGSFDLSGTRFSGKKATPPKMDGVMGKIMRYSENEENFAFGFWPGDGRFPYPAYFTYMYPQPSGMPAIKFVEGASFNEQLGECILPYETVRNSKDPQQTIMEFINSTYTESARLAKWDISSFQTEVPLITS